VFQIVREPLEAPLLPPNVAAGGVVTFEGRVRDLNDGQRVSALEYEAYDTLALREGERILTEARERFPLVGIACAHRVGLLQLGDVAIRVEAASAHRREAFEACEFVVDEVKRRVPIWKKEHYRAGPTEWLNAQGTNMVTEAAFYDRQMRLAEVGPAGQARLRKARVLVVGAGGLGCPALTYLAAAGVGTIGIVDADRVEATNLHRQPLYRAADVGRPKARLAAERLRAQNPLIRVEAFQERLTAENAAERLAPYDVVLDGTDNFATKFLLNDAAVLAAKTLVTASIHQLEGQIQVIRPGGPCLRCLWPAAPEDGCVGSCAEDGVLGFVPGVLGTLQAAEAVKAILGMPTLSTELALVDLGNLGVQRLRLPRDPRCPVCGEHPTVAALTPPPHVVTKIAPGDLLVDVREDEESDADPIPTALRMPSSRFAPDSPLFATASRVVLVCQRGTRSDTLARRLGNRFVSLAGGRSTLPREAP